MAALHHLAVYSKVLPTLSYLQGPKVVQEQPFPVAAGSLAGKTQEAELRQAMAECHWLIVSETSSPH